MSLRSFDFSNSVGTFLCSVLIRVASLVFLDVIITVFVLSSQDTLHPSASDINLTGTNVLELMIEGATSRVDETPLIFASVLPIVSTTDVLPFVPVTVFVASSQLISAPNASKIPLIGTRVLPFSITGIAS